MKKLLLAFVFGAFALTSHAQQHYVGGDISLLPTYEANGAWYMDGNNERITDMLGYLKAQGLNSLRVRLFVDPTKATDAEKGEGVRQDLEYVKTLGQRIKAAGFSLLLDFHYSDTWADPKQQITPESWQGLTDDQLKAKIYDYTKDCLQQMVAAGATPDFIQTGNEISYGMLWGARNASSSQLKKAYPDDAPSWNRLLGLLGQAAAACREVCPQAKLILHSEFVRNISLLQKFYKGLNSADYDIVGLSYYPYYHGGLSQLELALNWLSNNIDKDVMIVETGYYYAWQPSDVSYDLSSTWPITPAGQQQFTKDLIAELKAYNRVTGLYWWFMEACENGLDWNTKRVTDKWYNASLFNDTDNSIWGYGQVMPAMQELKAFAEGTSGVGSVTVTRRDGRWYNLQGMRYDAQPQRRGLYIVDGKKVFVK
jgi:arabinogalactan endo-1,4-beta-galactosidase